MWLSKEYYYYIIYLNWSDNDLKIETSNINESDRIVIICVNDCIIGYIIN